MAFVARRRDRPSEVVGAKVQVQDGLGVTINPSVREQLAPLDRAVGHNVSISADTNILGSDLSPVNTPCLFRIMVAVNTAGIFRAVITRAANTQVVNFNSGDNIVANAVYVFDVLVHSGDSVNFRHSVAGTLMVLRVQEIVGAVQ